METTFRHIYIVESREWWPAASIGYDSDRDLVLTFDLALHREIEAKGGVVRYVDHLRDPAEMQDNNFRMYDFFRTWHRDVNGNDIFRYRGIDFGFAFRIEIWNDYTFYVRLRLCLETLRELGCDALFVASGNNTIGEILDEMQLAYTALSRPVHEPQATYFFPIHQWMDERLRTRRPRHQLRDAIITIQGTAMSWVDRIVRKFRPRAAVFVQEYHPTRALLETLLSDPEVRVIQGHFSGIAGLGRLWRERPIPVYGRIDAKQAEADELLEDFRNRRASKLVLGTGADISGAVYLIIERRLAEVMPRMLRGLDCVIRYLDRHPLSLEILIGNLGQLAMLVDAVAKSRGVPSYLIINGLLGNDYLDEGKYATVINGYAPSIRDHYFRGMDNVVCLGDPRMDTYLPEQRRTIERRTPTFTIGRRDTILLILIPTSRWSSSFSMRC